MALKDCYTVNQLATVIAEQKPKAAHQTPWLDALASAQNTDRGTVVFQDAVFQDEELQQQSFTSRRGQQIAFHTIGEGEPVVFLTALAFSYGIWHYQIAELANRYQLIFPHLPGHPGSQVDGKRFTFEDIADDMAELMAHLHLSKVHLIGWCMAGNVAQIFALRHADKLRSLTLVCTTPTDIRERGLGASDLTEYSADPLLTYELELQNIYREDYFSESRVAQTLALISKHHAPVEMPALVHYMSNLFRFDTRKRLSAIDLPVLVIGGKQDIAFPAKQVALLAQGIKGAEYVEIEQAGHLPFINESELFNTTLEAFIKTCSTSENACGDNSQTLLRRLFAFFKRKTASNEV